MSTVSDGSKRRPGRPSLLDRQHALDQLLSLFWRKGYDAATQEEMLSATGLSSSTLFRSFGNKADILRAVLGHYAAYASVLFAPLERGDGGMADLQTFLDNMQDWLRGPMGPAGCLVVETMQNPVNGDPTIRALTDQHLNRLSQGLLAAVQRAADAGELEAAAPAPFAAALQAGVLGALSRARSGDMDDAVRLLNGVRSLLR
jgi:TetR/AcrR family transcriptional repressor of nem operon